MVPDMPDDQITMRGAAAPRTPGFRTTALIIASAVFMEQLDSTVLATALPAMARSFDVSPLHMSVALTAYLLGLAVFIPASGYVADRFGSRRVFAGAIALFTFGSILCGQADSLAFLTVARLLQGIGGAMMVPIGRLVLLRTVAKRDFVSAMTWIMVPALIGPLFGPAVGGLIVTYLSWHWIFFINVPIGVIGFVLVLAFIPDVREPRRSRFDRTGFVLSGLSLSCLTFGLEMSSRGAASPTTGLALVGAGILSGLLYLRHARHAPNPILDFRLMRIPTFGASVLGGSLTRIAGGGMPFLLPMLMQVGFGMSAAQSGAITFMTAVGSLLMKGLAAPTLRRFGFRAVLTANALIGSAFVALCAAFRPDWPLWTIYAVLLVGGFFQSLQFTAYNTVGYADVPADRMSAATSFYATFQQLLLSLGICISAATLAVSMALSGHATALFSDFSAAFLVIAAISALAFFACLRFPRNAGSEMSGHQPAE
jgi:EmrB/QacA subfamily drug resistance transporter